MKTLIFLPYFGRWNSYFKLWLHSCSYQKDFDWLILTDIPIAEVLPDNITVVYCTLQSLKEHFQKKLKMPLSLERPYKLCDYKPFYGYLLSEYLQKYDYWGYCDCDLIFGDIRKYLTRDLQKKYDKCIRTGHFSVIRNTPAINTAFLKYNTYKIVLTSPVIYGHDESIEGYHPGFAGELLNEGYRFFNLEQPVADIDFRRYPFYEMDHSGGPYIYFYNKGKLYRIYREKGKIVKSECMYVHLQKRRMSVDEAVNPECFLICPNHFTKCPSDIPEENPLLNSDIFWEQISQDKKGYFNRNAERFQNLYRDFRRLLHEPEKMDSLLYRFGKDGRKKNEKDINYSK